MPVAEAQVAADDREVAHYECAFHILPTVTEEEVPAVVARIEKLITDAGGTIANKEMPEQIDLAYEIVKPIEGYNRRFNAAHFGWVRFTLVPEALPEFSEEIGLMPELLRFITVRLTRAEEEQPFFMFAGRDEEAVSETDEAPADDAASAASDEPAA